MTSSRLLFVLRTFKPIKAICIILLLGLAAGLAAPAHAGTTITVDTNLDNNNTSDGLCSLREAITAANTDAAVDTCPAGSGADTITFAAPYTITLGSELPAITTTLTITGMGQDSTIIQAAQSRGGSSYRVLTVNAGNATLQNLTVRYGTCVTSCSVSGTIGGDILNNGGTLHLSGVTVSGGIALWGGGVADTSSLTTTIIDGGSLITGNTTAGSGNQIGGGIFHNSGSLTVDASTFSANTSDGDGGALYDQFGTVTVTNSRFINNSGGASAAVENGGLNASVSISGSCFTGNSPDAILSFGPNTHADGNWWGSPDGRGPAWPATYGDTVSGFVTTNSTLFTRPAGCGYNPAPEVSLSPSPLTFPGQALGTPTPPRTVTLTNSSSYPLKIGTLASGGDFALSVDMCSGQTIAPFESCSFGVIFTPSGSGALSGSVTIPSDAWNGPVSTLSLSGLGLLALTPPALKAPKDGMAVYIPPKLTWSGLKGAAGFHVEVDDDADFSSPEAVADPIKSPFAVASLPFGVYYWHVATRDLTNQGVYSAPFSFEVTLNKTPKKGAALKSGLVKFAWMGVKGKTYLLRINDETAHSVFYQTPSPLSKPTFTVDKAAPLPAGSYSWQVSIDGGATWTPAWGFTVP